MYSPSHTLHSLWYHHTYRCDDTRGCVMQFWPPDDEHMCSSSHKLHSLWYRHTYRSDDTRSCVMQFWPPDDEHMFSSSNTLHSLWYHQTYRCDDTRGCVMQFWPPDDEHTCSKHVEAWNKLIVKQKFCSSSSLITEINMLRCAVSKTSKYKNSSPCPCK